MTRPNAFEAQFDHEHNGEDPPGYRAAEAPFGAAAGGRELNVRLYEVPAGEALCPYHYEYTEEWLLVLIGEVKLRTPTGTEPLRAGDVACFPAGAAGAHQVFNDADGPARVVMFSSAIEPAVCVYPDSDKVGVWTPDQRDQWMFRGANGHLQYYDGESPGAS